MLTDNHIFLVQSSFKKVEPIADTAANLFYQRLFELDSELRSMFPENMAEQKMKLMQTIGVAVHGLRSLENIIPALHALGERHVGYGVENSQYETVGTALLWALEQGLGDDFTPEVREAWTQTYQVLAETAIQGAARAAS